jgi:peptidoglycan/xylan/chitin deacetylase (PgdA/CDA1 family)
MDILSNKSGDTPSQRIIAAKILLAAAALCLVLSLGTTVYLLLTPTKAAATPSRPIIHKNHQPSIQLSTDQLAQQAATTLAQSYLTAFLQGQYSTMWSQLHPDIQATWQNETTFANYWKARIQNYTIQTFTLGTAKASDHWTNPETMVSYNDVEQLSSSLQLVPKTPLVDQPPENMNPAQLMQNLPFIVQKNAAGQWLVLSGGPADLEAPITLPETTPATIQTVQVPILMYHHVSDIPTHNLLDYSLTITSANFAKQLDYLKGKGYHTITLNQLAAALYYGVPLPDKPIILSFDDGFADVYQYAYPLLQSHNYSGVFYIISGKVGWDGQMSWSQLRTMLANGMQVGSHTIHHVDMGETYQFSPMQAQQELQASQDTLQKNLHIAIQHFCYPNGAPFKTGSLLLRQEVAALVKQSGYITATTDPGMTGSDQTTDTALSLLRIRVDGRETQALFEASMPW